MHWIVVKAFFHSIYIEAGNALTSKNMMHLTKTTRSMAFITLLKISVV